jgi:hypothetical protein
MTGVDLVKHHADRVKMDTVEDASKKGKMDVVYVTTTR